VVPRAEALEMPSPDDQSLSSPDHLPEQATDRPHDSTIGRPDDQSLSSPDDLPEQEWQLPLKDVELLYPAAVSPAPPLTGLPPPEAWQLPTEIPEPLYPASVSPSPLAGLPSREALDLFVPSSMGSSRGKKRPSSRRQSKTSFSSTPRSTGRRSPAAREGSSGQAAAAHRTGKLHRGRTKVNHSSRVVRGGRAVRGSEPAEHGPARPRLTARPAAREQPQVQRHHPAMSFPNSPSIDFSGEEGVGDGVRCQVCGREDDGAHFLLCDGVGCQKGCHTYCDGLGMVVPEEDWYCKDCRSGGLGGRRQRRPSGSPRQSPAPSAPARKRRRSFSSSKPRKRFQPPRLPEVGSLRDRIFQAVKRAQEMAIMGAGPPIQKARSVNVRREPEPALKDIEDADSGLCQSSTESTSTANLRPADDEALSVQKAEGGDCCVVCGRKIDGHLLMLCSGRASTCVMLCHTYCDGLGVEMPDRPWFCRRCRAYPDQWDQVASDACEVCHSKEDAHLLLLCDGRRGQCNGMCHTYCDGLGNHVPARAWLCHTCRPAPALPAPPPEPARTVETVVRSTRSRR